METIIALILMFVGLANDNLGVLVVAALFAFASYIHISVDISDKGDDHV